MDEPFPNTLLILEENHPLLPSFLLPMEQISLHHSELFLTTGPSLEHKILFGKGPYLKNKRSYHMV
jgi:hypothetical protein